MSNDEKVKGGDDDLKVGRNILDKKEEKDENSESDDSSIDEKIHPTKDILSAVIYNDENLIKEFSRNLGKSGEDESKHNKNGNYSHSTISEGPDHNKDISRPLMDRYFSSIEAGSLRSSIFSLMSLALGIGCQSLPQQMERMGFLPGIVMLLICGFSGYWTYNLMFYTAKKHKTYDYTELASKIIGKWAGVFLDIIIILYIFGLIISYQVNIYKLLGKIIYSLFINKDSYHSVEDFESDFWDYYVYKLLIMYSTTLFVFVPTCMLEDVSKMRFTTIIAVFSMIYVLLVVLIQCPWFIHHFHQDKSTWNNINWFDITKGFEETLYFFRGTSVIIFAQIGHPGFFQVIKSLNNYTVKRRVTKVIYRTVLIQNIFYVSIAVSGFFTAPINTPDLIIFRENIVFSSDYFMIIAQIFVIIVLLMVTPVKYNSLRSSLLNLIYGNSDISKKKNLMITIPILLITTTIAFSYDVITNYLSIIGGFCGVFLGYLYPGYMYVKTNSLPRYHIKNILTMVFVVVISIVGMVATVRTLINIITGK